MARRYSRRNHSSGESIAGFIIIAIMGTLSKVKLKTAMFYGAMLLGVFLIGLIFYKRHRRKIILESGIDIIDKMDGVEFEKILLVHFKKQGYQGYLTPATNDYGADLVLEKNGQKMVVQAKRWKTIVGIEAVQQAIGAIKHYNAVTGMVITNSSFSQQAKNLARINNVELWDRKTLTGFLRSNSGRKVAESVLSLDQTDNCETSSHNLKEERCPSCGNKLVLRSGSRGKFLGCSGFPRCRLTKGFEA